MPHCSGCEYCDALFGETLSDYEYHCTYHDKWFSDRPPFAFVKVGCPNFVQRPHLSNPPLEELSKPVPPKGPWSTCEMCGGRFKGTDSHCTACFEKMESIVQKRKKVKKSKVKKPKLGQRKVLKKSAEE